MARTRNIKPAFFDNDILGDLQPLARLLFIGLWCISDREGRLEDRPRKIKKALLGYDDVNAEEVSGMLQQLHDNGFIIRYDIDDNEYIQIIKFTKHQNPHVKEKDSEIPPPPGYVTEKGEKSDTNTGQAPNKHSAYDDEEQGEYPADETEKEPTLQQKRFDEFWQAYPRKMGKQDAIKAWKKIKPDTELFDRIIRAVEEANRSEQWLRENGQYIPHPKTWLNGGRWDDEDIKINPSNTPGKKSSQSTMDVLAGIVNDEEGGVYDDQG